MKAFHATSGSGLAGLVLREHPMPEPGPREVLVRMRANSLNYRELSVLRGTYPLPVKPDVVMGADGAGEIAQIGPGVTRMRVGDRVAAAMFPRWIDGRIDWAYAPQIGGSLDGMMAEYVVLDQDAVVHLPVHLSFEEGATLPCAAVTAWNALTGARTLRAGETVLTLGSGAVSLFAIQLAKLFGGRVIATTSDEAKAARLRTLGADAVINYRTTPDWHLAVREATGGRGADQIIETAGASMDKSVRAASLDGLVNFIGRLDRNAATLDLDILYGAVATVRVVFAGSRAHFIEMNRAIAVGELRPVIDRIFPFEQLPDAFSYYESQSAMGKVVISYCG
jgi:NADPH:quinone reductase-like Zn-dependent oxidoreductase